MARELVAAEVAVGGAGGVEGAVEVQAAEDGGGADLDIKQGPLAIEKPV